jgi:AcrR family transcriptional regulator
MARPDGSSRGGTRTRQADGVVTRSSNRREQILRRTARLFVDSGFDATSMGEIAKANRISKPGLYYHFDSKQDLLAAIMDRVMSILESVREEIASSCSDPEECLRRITHEHALGITRRDAAESMLVIGGTGTLLPADRREMTQRKRAHVEFVRGLLDELKRQGRLRDVDTATAAFTVLGMIIWLTTWYRPRGRRTAEQVADDVTTMVLSAVLDNDDQSAVARPNSARSKSRARARSR